MNTAARVLLVLVLLVAGFAAYRWWNSPERQIRRTLDAIAERLTHDRPAAGLGAVAAAAGLQEYVAADVVVDAGRPFSAVNGRDAVVATAARIRTAIPALRVEFIDVQITLGADGTTATINCTASASIVDRAGQETVDARELTIHVRRSDARWVVERATVVQVLEPVT